MTTPVQENKVTKECDGIETEFDFSFKYLTNSDIKVYVIDIDANATEADLKTEGSDYSLTSADKTIGGTITFGTAPADTKQVFIIRKMPLTQGTSFRPNANFPEQVVEASLDKLTMITQQLSEVDSRCIKMGNNSKVSDIYMPEPIAGRALKWNTELNALENSGVDIDDAINVAQAAVVSAEASAESAASSASSAENTLTNLNAIIGSAISGATGIAEGYATTAGEEADNAAQSASEAAQSASDAAALANFHLSTEKTYTDENDEFVMYDSAVSGYKKIKRSNLYSANFKAVRSITSDTTLDASDFGKLIINNTTAAATLTLPAPTANAGKVIQVFNASANILTLAVSGSGSVYEKDYVQTKVLTKGTVFLVCDGTNYKIIGQNGNKGYYTGKMAKYSFLPLGYPFTDSDTLINGNGAFTHSSGTTTCKKAGLYLFNAIIGCSSATANTPFQVQVYKNGAGIADAYLYQQAVIVNQFTGGTLSFILNLSVGDTLKMLFYDYTYNRTWAYNHYISIVEV